MWITVSVLMEAVRKAAVFDEAGSCSPIGDARPDQVSLAFFTPHESLTLARVRQSVDSPSPAENRGEFKAEEQRVL